MAKPKKRAPSRAKAKAAPRRSRRAAASTPAPVPEERPIWSRLYESRSNFFADSYTAQFPESVPSEARHAQIDAARQAAVGLLNDGVAGHGDVRVLLSGSFGSVPHVSIKIIALSV